MSVQEPTATDMDEQAGFTVVEVLVAFTLFSLLSLLLLSSLRFGTKAWERSSAYSTRLEETIHAQTLLRQLVGAAYPSFVTLPGGAGYVDFDGDAGSVTFLADGPMSLDYGGRLRFTLSAEQREGRTDLILNTRPELAHPDSSALAARRTMLAKVGAVTIAYFGQKRSGGPAQWHDDWHREAELPELLRIRLTFGADDAGAWPELIVRPRVEADVSCIYDTLAKRCRGR
jgi:general secretion pathway protein J